MKTLKAFRLLFRGAASVVILFCAVAVNAAPQSNAPAGAQTITTANTFRLLLMITLKLQSTYGVPITFEDTRHVNNSELGKSGSSQRVLPDNVSVTYTITPPASDATLAERKAAVAPVLQDVVQKYNAARGAEMYQIVESDIGFHVVPKLVLDTSGKMEPFTSILDIPVTIQPVPTGQNPPEIKDVLDQIKQQLTASINEDGYSISINYPPNNPFENKTTLTALNEPARSVLDRLFTDLQLRPEYPTCCTWHINTPAGPHGGGYMVIEQVPAPPGTR